MWETFWADWVLKVVCKKNGGWMGDGVNNARHNFLVSKVPWICQHLLIKLPGLNSAQLVCDDMSSQTRKCATVSQHHHVTKSGVSKCTDSIRDAGARCCCIKVEGHSPIQKTTICKNAAAIFWRNIGKGAEVPNRVVSANFAKRAMSSVWVWWVLNNQWNALKECEEREFFFMHYRTGAVDWGGTAY